MVMSAFENEHERIEDLHETVDRLAVAWTPSR